MLMARSLTSMLILASGFLAEIVLAKISAEFSLVLKKQLDFWLKLLLLFSVTL